MYGYDDLSTDGDQDEMQERSDDDFDDLDFGGNEMAFSLFENSTNPGGDVPLAVNNKLLIKIAEFLIGLFVCIRLTKGKECHLIKEGDFVKRIA